MKEQHKKHAVLSPLSATGLQHKLQHKKSCQCEKCRGKLGAKLRNVVHKGHEVYPWAPGIDL